MDCDLFRPATTVRTIYSSSSRTSPIAPANCIVLQIQIGIAARHLNQNGLGDVWNLAAGCPWSFGGKSFIFFLGAAYHYFRRSRIENVQFNITSKATLAFRSNQ